MKLLQMPNTALIQRVHQTFLEDERFKKEASGLAMALGVEPDLIERFIADVYMVGYIEGMDSTRSQVMDLVKTYGL